MTITKAAPRRGDVPWSMAAERALIGAALLDAEEVWAEGVGSVVRAGDFFFAPHRAIWAGMLRLRQEQSAVTCITVAGMLVTMGVIDEVDELTAPEYAEPYLAGVMGETWAVSGCSAHARMVRDYADRRRRIEQAGLTARDAFEGRRAAGGRGGVSV